MRIVVGSTSKPKLSAVKSVFENFFGSGGIEIIALDVESGVSSTPFSVEECILGGRNRIQECKKQIADADYYVGIESGVIKTSEFLLLTPWAVILKASGKESIGSGALVPLPQEVFSKITPDVRISETMNYDLFDAKLAEQKTILGVGGIVTKGWVVRHDQVSLALKVALSTLEQEGYKKRKREKKG